jgi:hypothetical protein
MSREDEEDGDNKRTRNETTDNDKGEVGKKHYRLVTKESSPRAHAKHVLSCQRTPQYF